MKDDNQKQVIALHAIETRSIDIPQPKEEVDNRKGYVQFGDGNVYPDFLFDCYSECATLQSIINGLVDYICASGMTDQLKQDMVVNKKGELLLDIVKKCCSDYVIFGAFSLQVIRNLKGEVKELYWIDVRRVRLDEDEEKVFYRKEWKKYGEKPKVYDRWVRDYDHENCIYYYKRPAVRGVYGLPMWSSVTKDIMTSIEISKFHLSSILNNFAPSAIVNFNNGVPAKEEQREIERKLNEKFSGSTNAAKMMLVFNDNKEQAVTTERLTEDNFDQKYQALAKAVKENIFVAFRAQPQLFGTDPDRTGFNSQEYSESFQLFKKTVVAPIQSEIERAFKAIDPTFEFQLNEFQITFGSEEGEQI